MEELQQEKMPNNYQENYTVSMNPVTEATILDQFIIMRGQSIKERNLKMLQDRIDTFQDCMLLTVPVESAPLSDGQAAQSIWTDIEMAFMKNQLRSLMDALVTEP